MPREFKVGDKVHRVSGGGWREMVIGDTDIIKAIHPRSKALDLRTFGAGHESSRFELSLVQTPLEEAQADLADAERAVLDAKKRIDDLFTPVVGQTWASNTTKIAWTVAAILPDTREVILRQGSSANSVIYTNIELKSRCKLRA